ncbi:MAG: GNAT family N-acetyltransferase [Polyangiaceae bacterium]|nr:GNAT family N-acetyltransferase [Polyangiaceae bacterium]
MAISDRPRRIVVRPMQPADIPGIQALQRRCFPGLEPWNTKQILSQLERFPVGQVVIEYAGEIVATSSSLIVRGEGFENWHSFDTVAGGGYIANHDPQGDMLYGIDIAVDPAHRGLRLARRLYDARKQVVRDLGLRGMLIAGRIPGYHKHADSMTAEEYSRRVVRKLLKDPVLTAQLANGFAIRSVLPGYLPSDFESRGHAVLMEWLNPDRLPGENQAPRWVRVAAVQYQMRPVSSFEDFAAQCQFFAEAAGEYRADFVVFPERLTNQLQSLVMAERPALTARRLNEFTERYRELFTRMAIKYNVNVIAGSHFTVEDDHLYNAAYLFRRDGTRAKQHKLHITPSERTWWGVSPGDRLEVMETDRGKIAILVCYDIEFPELARVAASRGANILFVPTSTDIRSGYVRVRSCAQARCIENHVYAALSGTVGNLPLVRGADIHYGQACILTPSDVHFARDGVAEVATPNVETMLVHDLDLEVLRRTRQTGTVRPWQDRRTDLYAVEWKDGTSSSRI